MFPTFISKPDSELEELISRLVFSATSLGKDSPNPYLLAEVGSFLYQINSYYTNSMEGNPSLLIDIENALNHRYAKNKELRNYQLEHVAHICTQKNMIKKLKANSQIDVCSQEFICSLHHEFYSQLPDEMKFALTLGGKKTPVFPGQIRETPVQVGRHTHPQNLNEIKRYLNDFHFTFDLKNLSLQEKVIALASSHHRLLWIHPFSDGNGRIARLFTEAFSYQIGLNTHSLWNVARGFARNRKDYDTYLALADLPRRNALDGRGPLSEEELLKFCKFFLNSCLDQVNYMANVLNFKEIEKRFSSFLSYKKEMKHLSKNLLKVLEKIFKQGKLERKEILEICRVKQRRASQIIQEALQSGFCQSPSSYGPILLKITAEMSNFLFPDL